MGTQLDTPALTPWGLIRPGIMATGSVGTRDKADPAERHRQHLPGPVDTALKMVPMTDAVHIPLRRQSLGSERVLRRSDIMPDAATLLPDKLGRWAGAVSPPRVSRG